MNTTTSSPLPISVPATRDRALVLGGGGSTGNAWLIGVIAGLSDAGVDLTTADLTIGTSAGSTAAAQIAGENPADLYAAALTAPTPRQSAPAAPVTRPASAEPAPARPVVSGLDRLVAMIASAADADDYRRRLCASALELDAASDGSWSAQWAATVAARLSSQEWPDQRIVITAVDARTSEPVLFDRTSGVRLADAIAASCSSGLPYRIADARYLDGGFRTNAENADLAEGYARVVVLSPFGGRSLAPEGWGTHLAAQLDALRAGGSRVETVFPEAETEHLFGPNAMNPSLRPAAARAGYALAPSLAPRLAPFWS